MGRIGPNGTKSERMNEWTDVGLKRQRADFKFQDGVDNVDEHGHGRTRTDMDRHAIRDESAL